MNRETLILAAVQSGVLFLAVWLVFRLVPSVPANTKAWIWRLSFLKPLACLLPFAAVTLHVLPSTEVAATVQPAIVEAGTYAPSTSTAVVSTPIVESAPMVSIDPFLALWVVGIIAVFLYGTVNWVRVARMVRRAEPILDPRIHQALTELRYNSRTAKRIRLLASNEVKTPLLTGIVSPLIVLPGRAVEQEPIEDIRLMLAHEIAHLARKDLAWFGLVWIVQSLFFFNPVVWLAVRCARLDHESATDEHASKLAAVPIQTYAEMLLRATVVTRTSLAPGVLPMSESYRTIHRRIEAMKHFQSKPSFWRRSAFAALALGIVGLLPVYQLAEAAPAQQPPVPPQVSVPGLPVSPPPAKVVKGKKIVKPGKQKSKKGAKKIMPPAIVPGMPVPGIKGRTIIQPPLPGEAINIAPPALAAPGQQLVPLPDDGGRLSPPVQVPGQAPTILPPTEARGRSVPSVPGLGAPTTVPSLPGEGGATIAAPARAGQVGENGVLIAPVQATNVATYGGVLSPVQSTPVSTTAQGVVSLPGQGNTATISAYGVLVSQNKPKYSTVNSVSGVLSPQGKLKYTTTVNGSQLKPIKTTNGYTVLTQGKQTVKPLTNLKMLSQSKLSTGQAAYVTSLNSTLVAQGRLTYATRLASGKVSLRYEDADVRQVLAALFQQSGKSFIIDERVKGRVTVSFNELAFNDCLDAVLKTTNATFKVEKGIYRVFPRGK